MTLKIPAALWDRQYAAGLLQRYWATRADGAPVYTGSRFERLGGGGDRREVRNCFTAEDFVAVATVGAGKLLARKRPRLLPVYDAVVKKVFERPVSDLTFWSDMRTELRSDEGALVSHLEQIRDLAGIGRDIGVLRVLDVAAWMHGKGSGH
ncbi:DUF6308 family protein [Streptomyces sp. NBC_01456]|uniref:DUF6308 family protein n=1 Tax=unclassified Streptomyces TaxID=2593676 RepID=UPI002E2FA4A4|nr:MULTISPECIES: DUF6308 family protein [unclassified Streptomyces]